MPSVPRVNSGPVEPVKNHPALLCCAGCAGRAGRARQLLKPQLEPRKAVNLVTPFETELTPIYSDKQGQNSLTQNLTLINSTRVKDAATVIRHWHER